MMTICRRAETPACSIHATTYYKIRQKMVNRKYLTEPVYGCLIVVSESRRINRVPAHGTSLPEVERIELFHVLRP